MTKNTTKTVFSNAVGQIEEPTTYVYDAEINNYVEKPVSAIAAKSAQRQTTVYYNPEKNGYDEPAAP